MLSLPEGEEPPGQTLLICQSVFGAPGAFISYDSPQRRIFRYNLCIRSEKINHGLRAGIGHFADV